MDAYILNTEERPGLKRVIIMIIFYGCVKFGHPNSDVKEVIDYRDEVSIDILKFRNRFGINHHK